MEKTTSVNDFISSLPKIIQSWAVYYNGEHRGVVKATSYRKAFDYLPYSKFPDRAKIDLRYIGGEV